MKKVTAIVVSYNRCNGSTTVGVGVQEMIWGNPGHWEIADMAAARDAYAL
jgi:hypothetical protein